MDTHTLNELKHEWKRLHEELSKIFGSDIDLQALIFLIGVQELGQGKRKFSKDEKEALMHIATCRLLSIYGYYELSGADAEGWPQWSLKGKLPSLSLREQDILLKQSVIEYFKQSGFLN